MEIKITDYSCYDKGITSATDNVSSIIDKMIRLTAKLTENYASDIIYDIADLNNAVKRKKPLDNLLFFRENGVTTRTETKLIRVDVRKVGLF